MAQAGASRSVAAGAAQCFFLELEVTVASLVRAVLWSRHSPGAGEVGGGEHRPTREDEQESSRGFMESLQRRHQSP